MCLQAKHLAHCLILFLDIAPGNELYYYNKYAFNLMNRYEFIHDKYAGISFEHNIGNGIFSFFQNLNSGSSIQLKHFGVV